MKKQIIKIVFTEEDKIKRVKKFSRAAFGPLPSSRVIPAKKGGIYSRKAKHSSRDDD